MSEVAVITGTTHGIGRVTARELAQAGRTVVMLCRDLALASETQREIERVVPGAQVHAIHCNLSSFASVRAAAAEVRERFATLHVLINNAGIVSLIRRMSPDGFELTFLTNHLGPFLLTQLLLDRIDAQSGRIVNVSSRLHYKGRLDLESVTNPKARYAGTRAYAQSKLANVLYTLALARRLEHTGIAVNCLHPGVVTTNLLPRWLQILRPLIGRGMIDPERGARTSLYLALAPEMRGVKGRYFDEHQKEQTPAPIAADREVQERLWQRCAEWTGL